MAQKMGELTPRLLCPDAPYQKPGPQQRDDWDDSGAWELRIMN